MLNSDLTPGWIPIRVSWRGGGPEIDWCYLGERVFREPFFEDTIRAHLRDPINAQSLRHTGMDQLLGLDRPRLPLGGLIFHMSRCGSTLVSRALAADPAHLVISEAPPIDELLDTARRGASEEQRAEWLRALVGALAEPRSGRERRAFIKLDSWHIHDLPLIRRAFPEVPWLFIYRDPVEVMVSHQRLRGMQMAPGQIAPARLGLDEAAAGPPFNLNRYCARVLAGFCGAAAEHAAEHGGLLVNYEQLPGALWDIVFPHFAAGPDAAARELIELELQYHAKQPAQPFSPDSESKRREASAEIRELAEELVYPPFRRLEALRSSRTI